MIIIKENKPIPVDAVVADEMAAFEKEMDVLGEKELFGEMATSCHPKDKGGKYPMYIRVEYTDGEHTPAHAHLYSPAGKPSKKSLITKFIISEKAPRKPADIQVMKGQPTVPTDYAWMIIGWSKEKNKRGINNWLGLLNDWDGLEKSLR